jgi:hypothetical protein
MPQRTVFAHIFIFKGAYFGFHLYFFKAADKRFWEILVLGDLSLT